MEIDIVFFNSGRLSPSPIPPSLVSLNQIPCACSLSRTLLASCMPPFHHTCTGSTQRRWPDAKHRHRGGLLHYRRCPDLASPRATSAVKPSLLTDPASTTPAIVGNDTTTIGCARSWHMFYTLAASPHVPRFTADAAVKLAGVAAPCSCFTVVLPTCGPR